MNTQDDIDEKIKALEAEIRKTLEYSEKAIELIKFSEHMRIKILKEGIEKLKKTKLKSQ